jgi:hypothetical protein
VRIGATFAGIGLWLALAAPVFAQGPTEPRAFVGGLAGVTFVTETSSILGGQVGVRIARNLFVIGEIGRMWDVLPGEIADQIPLAEDFIESEFGVRADLDVKAPAFYGFGGIRWAQARGRLKPFAEAGAGFANIRGKIFVDGVNVTNQVENEIGDFGDLSTTEFLLAFGGGVNIGLTSTLSADAGYRYTVIFTDDPKPNTSIVYGAVKIRLGR